MFHGHKIISDVKYTSVYFLLLKKSNVECKEVENEKRIEIFYLLTVYQQTPKSKSSQLIKKLVSLSWFVL